MSEYIVEINESPTITLDGWNIRCDDMFIQREEVVRCYDCAYVDEESYGEWGRVWHCEQFGDVKPDGFCAWGERRPE